jgi:putative transposase
MRHWPHAPSRNFSGTGSNIVTASTYHKAKLFDSAAKLDFLNDLMFDVFEEFGWEPKAWAIFPNHHHFVAFQEASEINLMKMVKKLHGKSAIDLNKIDGTSGRTVWYRS